MCFTVSVGYAVLVKVLQEMLWGPISTPPETCITRWFWMCWFFIFDIHTQTNIIIVLIVEHISIKFDYMAMIIRRQEGCGLSD